MQILSVHSTASFAKNISTHHSIRRAVVKPSISNNVSAKHRSMRDDLMSRRWIIIFNNNFTSTAIECRPWRLSMKTTKLSRRQKLIYWYFRRIEDDKTPDTSVLRSYVSLLIDSRDDTTFLRHVCPKRDPFKILSSRLNGHKCKQLQLIDNSSDAKTSLIGFVPCLHCLGSCLTFCGLCRAKVH